MSTTRELWTCPACGVTEQIEGATVVALDTRRRAVQHGHAARHTAEGERAMLLVAALAEAVEAVARNRVRLVVAGPDADRVRAMVVRRELPIDVVVGDAVEPGHGYVMEPRRGVRER